VKILVVEDSMKLARFLSRVLTEEGFTVDLCQSGGDALEQAQRGIYDLILLDWMLPEVDGVTLCRTLRRSGNPTPILMLTARGETSERVLGLDAGADDYLVKPFEVEELVARVNALLRRASGMVRMRFDDLEIDKHNRRVAIGGEVVALTQREFQLLLHLVHRADRVCTRSDLLSQVWSTSFDPGSNVLEVHVSRLRDKLGKHAWRIVTVRGAGYLFRTHEAT
jgi:DNA-binding response OmpR family regulator